MTTITLTSIALVLNITVALAANAATLAIGSEGASPPWNSISANGELVGRGCGE